MSSKCLITKLANPVQKFLRILLSKWQSLVRSSGLSTSRYRSCLFDKRNNLFSSLRVYKSKMKQSVMQNLKIFFHSGVILSKMRRNLILELHRFNLSISGILNKFCSFFFLTFIEIRLCASFFILLVFYLEKQFLVLHFDLFRFKKFLR